MKFCNFRFLVYTYILVLLTQYTITQKTLQRACNLFERNDILIYFKLHSKCVLTYTIYKIFIVCLSFFIVICHMA